MLSGRRRVPLTAIATSPPPLLRGFYRRIYWARQDRRYWRDLLRIRRLFYLGGGGIGDSLNCSAVIHEWQRRHPGDASMMTPHPELFAGDPHIRSLHGYEHQLIEALRRWGRPVIHPGYGIPQAQPPRPPSTADHLAAQLCRSAGITGEVSLRPYFYFHPGEKEAFANYHDAVLIQSSCLNAAHTLPAKNWLVERMQSVVDSIRSRYRVVQIGHRDDTRLHGTEDLRGSLKLREVAAVVAQARFFVGLVGFLMHLARAVETRAVIVYGGREHPLQSGYIANENLVGITPCGPCGINDACAIGHDCMLQIHPRDVLGAIGRLELRLGTPLEVATVTLK